MWSIWQRSAGASQKGWVQHWSRTSMARRVAPVKKRAVVEHSIRVPGRKDDAFEVRPLQPGQQRTGGDDGPPFDPADAPMEGLITHQDAEEGLGTPVAVLGPLGAHRHLDQGVGATLRRCRPAHGPWGHARAPLWPPPTRPRRGPASIRANSPATMAPLIGSRLAPKRYIP